MLDTGLQLTKNTTEGPKEGNVPLLIPIVRTESTKRALVTRRTNSPVMLKQTETMRQTATRKR